MKRKAIVFGINHMNTLGLIRGLGVCDYEVIVLLEPCSRYFCALRFSKYIAKIHYLQSVEEGVLLLKNEYRNSDGRIPVLSGSDSSISALDNAHEELKDSFVVFNAGSCGRINYFMNKANTFPLAEKCGLTLIKTWRIISREKLPTDIIYPCIIKGNNSTSSRKSDMHVCLDEHELYNHLRETGDYLVQEFLKKEYELDIVGFSWNHGHNVVLPAAVNKVREFLDRQSLFDRLDDIGKYPNLPIGAIKDFVCALGYEGIFSVELLYSRGLYHFLEINLRNDGTTFIYTKAGINYPLLWAKYAYGELTDFCEKDMKMRTPCYMMQEADLYAMFQGRVGFWRWCKDFVKTDVFPVLDIRDMGPFMYTMLVHVLQVGKRLLRMCGFNIKLR